MNELKDDRMHDAAKCMEENEDWLKGPECECLNSNIGAVCVVCLCVCAESMAKSFCNRKPGCSAREPPSLVLSCQLRDQLCLWSNFSVGSSHSQVTSLVLGLFRGLEP